ncbi:MAG: hypothetical protein A3F43_06230 [Gammaproteobacteria bacterium RIFCSPHIGHO2_12_FULL_42_10]|nr:MAG: hypothetical protein A3F43_06230 [Gammaproteobacteria bacterium RIFCSPHIGHO2_12_FULL_42_10]
MKNQLKSHIQAEAYKLVLGQLIGVLILAVLTLLFKNKIDSLSVLAGGLTYGFLNLLFVAVVFRYYRAQEMHKFMAAFMLSETLKLIFSAIIFLMIVKHLPVSLLFTLVGLIGAIVSFWIASFWYFTRS